MNDRKDAAQAVLAAATGWLAEIAHAQREALSRIPAGGSTRVDVRVCDVAGERPRIELVVGDQVIGHTELMRMNSTLAN